MKSYPSKFETEEPATTMHRPPLKLHRSPIPQSPNMVQDYNPTRFQQQIDRALESVKRVLHNNRAPALPQAVPHQYDDKYLVAEMLTNTALAAHLNCLELLGLKGKDTIAKLTQWVEDRSITLRFKSEEKCTFNRKTKRDVESNTKSQTNWGGVEKTTRKTVTTVTDHFWDFQVTYQIFAFKGNDPEEKELLLSRTATHEIQTDTETPPRPASTVQPSIDHQLTWLFQQLRASNIGFSINREDKKCHTPTRNSEMTATFAYFHSFHEWSSNVIDYFKNQLFQVQSGHNLDLSKIKDSAFVPIFPLFEEPTPERISLKESMTSSSGALTISKVPTESPLLSMGDINAFLNEEMRSLKENFADMDKLFPKTKLITSAEAQIIVVLMHSKNISQHHSDGIYYIEGMLRSQLISAIGKTVTSIDFVNYMRYHNRKLFKLQYQPAPFCYAVRRGLRNPEGTVGIDFQLDDGSPPLPINTIVRHTRPIQMMKFPINASTKVSFGGDRYLHAFIQSKFSGETGFSLTLNARARQFSTFMVLIGKIATVELFEPTYAMIVQNKDEFIIPLEFESIPPPKVFKDAISSLSPEQQRFAQAYRSMQLGGTLFSICILQIKPQLERLLQLPPNSLSKELKLTQSILELLMTYQIPSDLLSYNKDPQANTYTKIQTVKQYTQKLQDMIKDYKTKQLEEKKQEVQRVYDTSSSGSDTDESSIDEEECEDFSYGAKSLPAVRRRVAPTIRKVVTTMKSKSKPMKLALTKQKSEPEPQKKRRQTQQLQDAKEEKCKELAVEAPEKRKVKMREIAEIAEIALEMAPGAVDWAEERQFSIEREMAPEWNSEKGDLSKKKRKMPVKEKKKIMSEYDESSKLVAMPQRVVQNDPRIAELEMQIEANVNHMASHTEKGEKQIAEKKAQIEALKKTEAALEEAIQEAISAKSASVEECEPQDEAIDYPKVPSQLDQKFEKLDEDSALSASIINPSTCWTKKFQPGLLSPPQEVGLGTTEIVNEKNKAFDLLDALTRSGALPVVDASLHVLLCATHSFDKSIIDTLVEDNMNPIEKLERSNLIVATTIHDKSVEELVNESEFENVRKYCPTLFLQ